MRKMLLTPFVVCMVALLSMLSMPVHATPPISAQGCFDYTYEITGTRMSEEGNLFLYATEHEWWIGDFTGESDAVFRVEIFTYEGFWNVWLRSTFTGTVQGKSGTLVIQLVGKKPEGLDWYGQWMIISGTDELANLRGQGVWWGPGYEGTEIPGARPDIYYSGLIHFD